MRVLFKEFPFTRGARKLSAVFIAKEYAGLSLFDENGKEWYSDGRQWLEVQEEREEWCYF